MYKKTTNDQQLTLSDSKEKQRKNGCVIISVYSGLGNQMFHYAYYKYLLLKGINAYIDVNGHELKKQYQSHETYRLSYFDLPDIKIADKKMINEIMDISREKPWAALRGETKNIFILLVIIFKKVMRKLQRKFGINFYKTFNHVYEHKNDYYSGINNKSRIYLSGRYQSYKHLMNIRDVLLSSFSFKLELPDYVKNILSDIGYNNSCSIHIRRNDYAGAREYDVCPLAYYKNAVNYLVAKYSDIKFYVFSDDIDWVKNNFNFIKNYMIVDTSDEKCSDYFDMFLMTKTNHNIIPNSTFSWWGAWLNQNLTKIVIVPTKWNGFNYVLTDEICPPEWIRISRE
jgi:hypothetical protein